jgi:ribonuclease BN (tRNA processing enzyme)
MCLVPGLADGRYLTDGDLLPQELATQAGCTCHHGHVSRRGLLTGSLKVAGGLALAGGLLSRAAPASAQAPSVVVPSTGDAIVPLGVNGGPVLSLAHSQPSLALVVNGTTYLVDAGADAPMQLVKAGISYGSLAHLFITHHHSDHVGGYPALAILGWTQNPGYRRLDVWGPPPMKQMHAAVLDLFAVDIPSRIYGGSKPIDGLLFPHEIRLGRTAIKPVFRDGNVSVSAVRVSHGPDIKDAYAYRFDVARDGTSVVFSGDTAPTDTLVELARDADVLVHEVLSLQGVEILGQHVDPTVFPALRQHLLESHTTSTDVVSVAKRANVKRLVLTHYAPNTLPIDAITAEVRRAAADADFAGDVIGATELSPIPLQA